MAASCRGAALRFLKIRPRSVFELRAKLTAKGFSSGDIDDAVAYLESIGLLDDRAFTASWIAHRLARPFGFRRIITELKAKGIAEDIWQNAVAQARGAYVESNVIAELAERRAERLRGIDPVKRRKRVGDFLLRRGFPMDAVLKAIRKI